MLLRDQAAPLVTFALPRSGVAVLQAVWSPARPLVFAVGDALGQLHIFDLLVSACVPCLIRLTMQGVLTASSDLQYLTG